MAEQLELFLATMINHIMKTLSHQNSLDLVSRGHMAPITVQDLSEKVSHAWFDEYSWNHD